MSDAPPLQLSVLTPHGRGAVAAIQLRGDLSLIDPYFSPLTKGSAAAQPLQAIRYGHWGNEPAEDVVFIRTAEQSAEVHCHGGIAAVRRITNDLKAAGGAVLPAQSRPGTQTPLEFDFERALLQASTMRSAALILAQRQRFQEALKRLSNAPELVRQQAVNEMLSWSDYGRHLIEPWRVVLFGRPNVGKSSLINALIGYERSIVFDQSGTTRDVVREQTALGGWPVEFADTAGLRDGASEIESAGIQRARESVLAADLRLIILDATGGITTEDQALIDEFPNAMVVWNKCDLMANEPLTDGVLVSALTQHGVDELARQILDRLVPQHPDADQIYPVTELQRQLLCDLR